MSAREQVAQCPFCRIARHVEPAAFIYEDKELMAFMDKNPISLGHALVAPKAHYGTLLEMEPELVGRLFSLAARIARAIWEALRPDGLNLLQNNLPAAGQTVPHVHVHVIPRYYGDGIAIRWPARHKSLQELEEVAKRIREAFR